MIMFASTQNIIRKFKACTKGNASMIMGIVAIPMIFSVGTAVDFARIGSVKERATIALDAGVLAAVTEIRNDTDVTPADITRAQAAAVTSFRANLGDIHGAHVNNPVFTLNAAKDGFSASVTGRVKSSFMYIKNVTPTTDFTIKANAVAGREQIIGSDLEVALMLDVTGSMCDDPQNDQPCAVASKLNTLQTAAKKLVNDLVWTDQSEYKARVSVVPFSSSVRLAADGQAASSKFTQITGMPATWSGYAGTTTMRNTAANTRTKCQALSNYYSWSDSKCYVWQANYVSNLRAEPCVTERFGPILNAQGTVVSTSYGLTDDPPGANFFSNGNDGTRSPVAANSGTTALSPNGATAATRLSSSPGSYSAAGNCEGIHNTNVMIPLTNNKGLINSTIDNLQGKGGTAGLLGTTYAWYTLSPKWASIWGTDSAPAPYEKTKELNAAGKPKLFKIAILMTDGVYNYRRGQNYSNNPSEITRIENDTKALCNAMELEGIEIYTIGFELEPDSSSKTMLEDCAKDADHFKDAGDDAALTAAFAEIAKRIKEQSEIAVRLTQ
jgi:Flp pilus assembly protein TadG